MDVLSVNPIERTFANKGLARLDETVAEKLGVDSGDYLLLETDTGQAIVRYYGEGTGLEIDGQIRHSLGAGIGDSVEVDTIDIAGADSIEVARPEGAQFVGNAEKTIKEKLSGMVVWAGRAVTMPVPLSTEELAVQITEVEPAGAAVVTDLTTIELVTRPESESTAITYDDIGGLNDELDAIREMVDLPHQNPELFEAVDVESPNGIILHGPPGTGKTLMAKAVANENDAYFESISGPEIMSKYYGESESRIREVFDRAQEQAPSIIFIDELDSIAPKREESGSTERRIVAQLLAIMDGLEERKDVTVIAATNRLDSIDPALRRPGRFDREVEIGVPDAEGRKQIFEVHSRNMPIADDVDTAALYEDTYGFVGADIENLLREAGMNCIRRHFPTDDVSNVVVTQEDFDVARRKVTPSAMREVFVESPDVTWDDVGGLVETKSSLQESVEWPQEHPELLKEFAVTPPSGVLLYGPPGTGKTLMAKAVANESNSNFISVAGPELFDKYVGESEKGVREIFEKARENAPTVVFFDELDAVAMERGSTESSTGVGERVVSQLLTEMDGLEPRDGVTVIATSNRPDRIDGALLRPGRLDRQVHVPVPDAEARRAILDIHTRDMPTGGLDITWLVSETEGFVGADIEALCQEAAMQAVRERVAGGKGKAVKAEHFKAALEEIHPTVTEEVREQYEQMERHIKQAKVEDDSHDTSPGFM